MKQITFLVKSLIFWFLLSIISSISCKRPDGNLIIYSSDQYPEIEFGIEELRKILLEQGFQTEAGNQEEADILIYSNQDNNLIKPEGFILQRDDGHKIKIISSDAAGAMYGVLELAEQARISSLKGIKETTQNPYMEMRGTKFNIPLDVRTPSYSDPCDAAQSNIPEMWSFDFWKEYIDNLARYRFNFISIWNLHPFPSMVRVPGYEEVALDNVERSVTEWKEYYPLEGTGFDSPEITGNTEIVKEISIDEKIEFWKKVMAYGKSRNIDFYLVTWNIFVNGTAGKYGITDDINNDMTRDYFRKSVKQMFITYPDLAGIGLTTGENMSGSNLNEKEDWAFDTYAQGILDAALEMPERQFTLIHRQHMAGANEIAEKFKPLIDRKNIRFLFSFKYAQAHVMSSTTQPFSDGFVKEIAGMKTLWTLRNDDNYYFRWGAPDFVREFIQNIPYDASQGFYYGSDQWVWGREFLMKEPESPRQLEIVKHWYQWMMWGRLGYNPQLTNEWFVNILKCHFRIKDADRLFEAWQNASLIYPKTTGFHWGSLDFQWYIEGCKSAPGFAMNKTGFHDVNRFISLGTHPGAGMQAIPDFVKMTMKGEGTDLITPLDVSRKLHEHSQKALEILESLEPGKDKELSFTLQDIKTMALLGRYYAYKIAGSTYVGLYRETNDTKYQEEAVNQLTNALDAWKEYTREAMKQNHNPLWTNRVGYVDWIRFTQYVEEDIEIAKMK
jgi:hypothetical protein